MKRLLGKGRTGLFATRTLSGHLIRGAVGVALIYVAISQQHPQPGWSMLAGLLSLVALRGCPACWTVGLVESAPSADPAPPGSRTGRGFTVPNVGRLVAGGRRTEADRQAAWTDERAGSC